MQASSFDNMHYQHDNHLDYTAISFILTLTLCFTFTLFFLHKRILNLQRLHTAVNVTILLQTQKYKTNDVLKSKLYLLIYFYFIQFKKLKLVLFAMYTMYNMLNMYKTVWL